MARATFPIRAVLYEIMTRFAEEAIASCSTARPTRTAKRAEAVAAANPATHTATETVENLYASSSIARHHRLRFDKKDCSRGKGYSSTSSSPAVKFLEGSFPKQFWFI